MISKIIHSVSILLKHLRIKICCIERRPLMFFHKLSVLMFSVFFILVSCRCSLPEGSETFRVLSWNVQNLFDAVDDGSEYREFDPGGDTWNRQLYQKRLQRTADVIISAEGGAPDLIVLQELENPRILDDLVSGPLAGRGYRWTLSIPGYSIIRCGILSRYPLKDIEVSDCGTWGIRPLRPALSFTVEVPGTSLRVAAGHWKSPRDGRAATESARCREAEALRKMLLPLLTLNPAADVLIIGDLNTPGDGLVRPAALAPWYPELSPESAEAVLYRTDIPEFAGFRDGLAVFFDPDPDPAAGSPGTYWYHDDWERPDRALLSRGLVDAPGLIFESCRTLNETAGDEFGRPFRWRTDRGEGYSDHLPLLLEFRMITGDGGA